MCPLERSHPGQGEIIPKYGSVESWQVGLRKTPRGVESKGLLCKCRIQSLGNCLCTPGHGARVCTYRAPSLILTSPSEVVSGTVDVVEHPWGRLAELPRASAVLMQTGMFSSTHRKLAAMDVVGDGNPLEQQALTLTRS